MFGNFLGGATPKKKDGTTTSGDKFLTPTNSSIATSPAAKAKASPMSTTPKPPKNNKEGEGFDYLPETFQVKQKGDYHNLDNCEFCFRNFTFRQPRHHCRKCAKTVCERCSVKRRLSKCDGELHYCCFECEFTIINQRNYEALDKAKKAQKDMLESLTNTLTKADEDVPAMEYRLEIKKKGIDQVLTDHYRWVFEQQKDIKEAKARAHEVTTYVDSRRKIARANE